MLKNLNFVYYVDNDNKNQTLLVKSIETLIKSYNVHDLYICYTNCINFIFKLANTITKYKEKYNRKNINVYYKFIPKEITKIIRFPKDASVNKVYLGRNSLIRFFIPYFLNCDNVYWVDNDVLFNGEASEYLKSFDNDNTLIRIWDVKVHGSSRGLNAGFMYINCKIWKNDYNIIKDILDFYYNNHEIIKYMNQDCYKYLITEKYKNICLLESNCGINVKSFNFSENIYIYHFPGKDKVGFHEIYNFIINGELTQH